MTPEQKAAEKIQSKQEAYAALDAAQKSFRALLSKQHPNSLALSRARKLCEAYAARASALAGFKIHPFG